ncbi:MAG: GTP-binding protein [Candidatus Bathyarchaeia archaeon]
MKPRLALVGGFLGSGKTTLLLRLGEILTNEYEKRVVMVTNDQGEVLVDSAIAKDYGFEVAEVIRGCFCCNFQVFINHTRRVLEKLKPDVILAEPVGSCAGLMPTLYVPIKEFYSNEFELAPLIVIVDASRILMLHQEINLLDTGDPISFLITSQIKEGEILCVNKIDLVDDSTIAETLNLLKKIRPEAEYVLTSAKFNVGVDKIVEVVLKGISKRLPYPDIDMVKYTQAELELAWFDGLYELKSEQYFNPKEFIIDILAEIAKQITERNGFIAHVKAYLRTDKGVFKASITSIEQGVTVTGFKNTDYTSSGVLLLNARVKLSPDELDGIISNVIERIALEQCIVPSKIRSESFRPKPPKPQFYVPYSEHKK